MTAVSRKGSLGKLIGREGTEARIVASVAAALLAAHSGARILRVHDVRETMDALAVLQGFEGAQTRLQSAD